MIIMDFLCGMTMQYWPKNFESRLLRETLTVTKGVAPKMPLPHWVAPENVRDLYTHVHGSLTQNCWILKIKKAKYKYGEELTMVIWVASSA